MEEYDKELVKKRLREEILRYRVGKATWPTEDDMSVAIGRHYQFIRQFQNKKTPHNLNSKDLYYLESLYNLDINYIITGKRIKK